MPAFENPLNVDPGLKLHQNETSDENFSDYHPSQPSTLKEYTNSMLKNTDRSFYAYKNNSNRNSNSNLLQKQQQQQQPLPSLINASNRNSNIYGRDRIPSVKSFENNEVRRSVKQMLINDHNRDENVVLKQLNNVQSNSNAVRVPTSPVIPFENVDVVNEGTTENNNVNIKHFNFRKVPSIGASSNIDNVPLLELYKSDDIESRIESKSLKSKSLLPPYSSLPVSASASESPSQPLKFCSSSAIKEKEKNEISNVSLDDPRISFLNPHQAYVKVAPPMLGKPLAENGTPLDLSKVSPRNELASPLRDIEEKKVTDDELKLFSVLKYEFKLDSSTNNCGDDYFVDLDNGYMEMESNEHCGLNDEDDKKPSWISSIFQRIFKLGSFSEEAKYFKNFPWAHILHNIDNPTTSTMDIENQATSYEQTNYFERNNTDMFPVIVTSPLDEFSANTEYLRRQKCNGVPSH